MVPGNLNKDDPCYVGIRRIGAILSQAESEGRIHKRELRLDIFFTPAGAIRGYRVNRRTKVGWQAVTFFEEDLSGVADDDYFQQRLAERLQEILSGSAADEY
jgi:hypothetical protein